MESLKSPLSKVKDRFTRWPEAFPLRDISALTIARALVAGWISRFGVPSTVTTDRGSQFESSVLAQLTRLLVLERTEKYDVIDINGTRDTISVDRLKSAHIDKTITIILPNHDSLLTNTSHSHSTSSSTPLTTDSFKANTTRLETDSTGLDTDTNCSKTNGTHTDTNITHSSQRVRFPKLLNI
uniref:Integrase catalytic domain-containing protein n=1 Tax=Amphimedon queenslandica TaxID=400682 RepID=A0A1X7UDA4_AMPQE